MKGKFFALSHTCVCKLCLFFVGGYQRRLITTFPIVHFTKANHRNLDQDIELCLACFISLESKMAVKLCSHQKYKNHTFLKNGLRFLFTFLFLFYGKSINFALFCQNRIYLYTDPLVDPVLYIHIQPVQNFQLIFRYAALLSHINALCYKALLSWRHLAGT